MDLLGSNALNALQDLCRPPDENSDSEDEKPSAPMYKMGPSDIGPKSSSKKAKEPAKVKPPSKDIWDSEELPDGAEYEDIHDPRPTPEYDIIYKQAVTSEDMFLQMGNKTPATASCEMMVVKIQLPDTKGADIKLDVKPKFVDCRTPKFKLGLHLPHPVDDKTGKAQWDVDKSILAVTLKLNREYDFINF